jgi:hypothetical protein
MTYRTSVAGALIKTKRTVRRGKHPPDNMHALKNIYLFGYCRRSKQKKQTLKQNLKRQKEDPLKETKCIIERDKHILLPIRTKSQLSILSVAPTNAGGISTNKMVHITRIHAT